MTHSTARLAVQNIAGIIGLSIIFTTNSLVILSKCASEFLSDRLL